MTKKLSLILLITIGFLVYLPSFWNQFLWDDEQFIYRNQYVLEFNLPALLTENTIAGAGEISNYYRPLTSLTFALDHAIWGLTPLGFHLTNTTLHISAGVLIYLLLRELGLKRPAFWIAALFLLHPIQTEAVTYVNSRGDSLFAFFVLLSLYSFTLGLHQKKMTLKLSDRVLKFSAPHFLLLSLVSYTMGLFSKEIAIAAVGIHTLVLGRDYLTNSGGASLRRWLIEKKAAIVTWVTLGVTALAYLIARATILNFNNSFNFYGYESEYTSSLTVRLLTFSKSLWWYWRWLFVPYPLHMERDLELVTSLASPWPWATLLIICLVIGLGWREWRIKRTTWIWFGWAWFFIWMSPMSGLIPINGILYEHWLYLPIVGFWLTLYGLLRLLNYKFSPSLITKSLIVVLSIAALLTIRQNYIWRAPIPFYEYTLQYADSARLHNNLAMAYDEAGQTQKAIDEYQAALKVSNIYPQIYYNLGNSYVQTGELDQAEAAFKRALELSPTFEPAYRPLINLYLQREAYEPALPLVSTLLQTYPQQSQLWLIQGLVLTKLERTEEATVSFANAKKYAQSLPQTTKAIENILKNEPQ